jgi:hypothetical protein
MLEKQIRDLLERYLDHEVDRATFAQVFAGLYFQARNDRNLSQDVRQLCDSLVLPFAELSRGHRSESSFREELTRIARPFGPRIVSIDSYSPADPCVIDEVLDVDLDQSIRKPPQQAGMVGRVDDHRRVLRARSAVA